MNTKVAQHAASKRRTARPARAGAWALAALLAFCGKGAAQTAGVLYSDAFSSGTIGYQGSFDAWGASEFGPARWVAQDGRLVSGDSTAPLEKFIWQTGAYSWRDVAVTAEISAARTGGYVGILLRAAGQDTYYEFRVTTGRPNLAPEEAASGLWRNASDVNYRILKYVNGRVRLLAEVDASEALPLPAMHPGGSHEGRPLALRFEAVGDRLTAFVKPGDVWVRILSAQDDELKGGRVGFSHWEYEPAFHSISVEPR